MSVTRSLTFLWTPWTAGPLGRRRAGHGRSRLRRLAAQRLPASMGLLELLRLALVAIVAVLLNQPEWIEEFRPEEKPSIAVLLGRLAQHGDPRRRRGPTSRRPRPTTRNQAIAAAGRSGILGASCGSG